MTARAQQTMKPGTAAKKLGIHLPAAPQTFQDAAAVSRSELAALISAPPAWLRDLRDNGPHPREVVASRLGVSIAGLARGAVTEPLLTADIVELAQHPPSWLVRERATHADVTAEQERVAARDAERALHPPRTPPAR